MCELRDARDGFEKDSTVGLVEPGGKAYTQPKREKRERERDKMHDGLLGCEDMRKCTQLAPNHCCGLPFGTTLMHIATS